ncbi:MAG: dipeptide epimerase [Deltaproteobacteria bacterium]|nr:dipeptide epimerase [Deltaproteobacteria bacterium]
MSARTHIKSSPLTLRYKHPFGISRWTHRCTLNILVRVECEGIVGQGEGAPNARYGDSQELALEELQQLEDSLLELGDVQSADALTEALEGARGKFSSLSAAAALDMACHDWLAKRMGKSLCELWGWPLEPGPESAFTIGIDEPAVMARKVQEAEAYPLLKIKLGSEHDAEILSAVRGVTRKPLWVDVNEGWPSAQEALTQIEVLAELGVRLVEQPLAAGQLDEMRWLKARSPLQIFADEDLQPGADVAQLAEGYDGVNIKLDKAGGLIPAKRMLEDARRAGLKVMVGCMIASSLAITAAGHLALRADLADLDGHLLLEEDPFEGLELKSGRVILPGGPGIGAVLRGAPNLQPLP